MVRLIELLYIRVVRNMTKKFQKTVENFVCEHCGAKVVGNGYTDHCPVCLWGKHVDVNPGDRASDCCGAMKPMGISYKNSETRIEYKCEKCGHPFVVRAADDDDMNKIILLSSTNTGTDVSS